GLDGRAQIQKALVLRPNDAQLEFAAALVSLGGPDAESREHARKAVAGSEGDPLLARNLAIHFLGPQSPTMAEMIARDASTKAARAEAPQSPLRRLAQPYPRPRQP